MNGTISGLGRESRGDFVYDGGKHLTAALVWWTRPHAKQLAKVDFCHSGGLLKLKSLFSPSNHCEMP
jgi:hypothetical protein